MIHYDVGVGQIAADPIIAAFHIGLTGQVTGEEQASADLVLIEVLLQFDARNTRAFLDRNRETEPGGIAVRSRFRQYQEFATGLQLFLQIGKVALARGDESFGLLKLCQTASGLHIGDLQVVAEVRIRVLVVVAFRQAAQLPRETLHAGVVLAWLAIAVATPVAEGLGDLLQLMVVGEDRTTFAHRDMVGRVEAQRCDVAEGADQLSVVS